MSFPIFRYQVREHPSHSDECGGYNAHALLAGCIKDTPLWKEQRVTEKLPEFLEEVADKPKSLGKAAKDVGAPHTIIVTGAGLRAANIVR